ncbi:hypothetical protein B0H17DRAFT_1148096 [Mycena rosella]|uniref:Uncharacterized protein n=1 Tax=Mycena rosella TaxID=1033263 RepID=A0AAD7FXM2_MYCRO|nr:hypothetical protein B0H17DRAFT_1148096 [Mycena rosella]
MGRTPELSSGSIRPLTCLVKCPDVSVATMQPRVFGNRWVGLNLQIQSIWLCKMIEGKHLKTEPEQVPNQPVHIKFDFFQGKIQGGMAPGQGINMSVTARNSPAAPGGFSTVTLLLMCLDSSPPAMNLDPVKIGKLSYSWNQYPHQIICGPAG